MTEYRNKMIKEPSLREMLGDPIVRALMSRDGVSEQNIAEVVERARHRLAKATNTSSGPAPNLSVRPGTF